jgi:hypothetical protein
MYVTPGLDPGVHRFFANFFKEDGLPGHKCVYARLQRAMPGNDDPMRGYFFCAAPAPFGAGRAPWELSALSGSRFHVWLRPNNEMPR